jgi:hypothetical protein
MQADHLMDMGGVSMYKDTLCQNAKSEVRYSLDVVVKIRIQLQHAKAAGAEGCDRVLDCFRQIIRQ